MSSLSNNRFPLRWVASVLVACLGCEPAARLSGPFVPGVPMVPMPALDCERTIELSDGDVRCVDDIVAAIDNADLFDIDGDGIPNLNDEDIDGDGVPNRFDVDVDGDGLFNGIDDDVDADGVSNGMDADVDGDFIRNRWDIDIDGDLVFNPYDGDADGDGFEDPVAPEDEPMDQSNNNSDDDEDDDDTDDPEATPEETGMNAPAMIDSVSAEPSVAEMRAIDDQLSTVLEIDQDEIVTLRASLTEAESGLEPEDYFDGFHRLVIDALVDSDTANEDENGDIVPSAPVAARVDLPQRIDAVLRLAPIEPDLDEIIENADVLFDAARDLGAALENLVDTSVAYGALDPTPDVSDATLVGIELHDIANDNQISPTEVADLVPPSVNASENLDGSSAEIDPVPVFRLVAELTAEFQDESSNPTFAPLQVARMIERLTEIVDPPSIDLVGSSARNILLAAGGDAQVAPLEIVGALIDEGIDVSDGVDRDEAERAAAAVVANAY